MLDMQNVKDIEITEGNVRTIHDKDNRLIWGRLNYDTKYAGDTYQQTYSGKNLLPNNAVGSTVKNDVTFTVDSTGRITVNGTATANTYYSVPIITLSAGEYVISGLPANGSGSTFKMTFTFAGSQQNCFSVNGKSFSLSAEATSTEHYIFIANGYHADNLVFEPMIEAGQSKTSYEPYVGGIPAPNPDYPQAVQVVTGEQTVTVSDGVSSQSYLIELGSIELCKIGNYEDKIFNNDPDEDWYNPELEDNAWYVHKATNKFTVTSSLAGLGKSGTTSNNAFYYSQGFQDIDKTDMGVGASSTSVTSCFTPFFTPTSTYNLLNSSTIGVSFNKYSGSDYVDFRIGFGINSNVNTLALFKTWLDTNELKVYYPLATPTDTKITDATLIGQLNDVHEWLTRYGYNATVSGNLPIIINQTNL